MSPDISPERTILARAQQTVDRWRQARETGSFNTELARSASLFWDEQPASQISREAFCKVADAIRRGEGHAFRNCEPLLRIVRQSFHGNSEDRSDNFPSGF